VEVVSDLQVGDAGTLDKEVSERVDELVVWFGDVGLPRFLSGKLDIDGVNVGRRDWQITMSGGKELGEELHMGFGGCAGEGWWRRQEVT
jgi:hypothetical protein